MRALLITDNPFEQPFSVHQQTAKKISPQSIDSPSMKIISTMMSVLFAVITAAVIITAGIRFQDNHFAYQYFAQVTHSVPLAVQQ